MLIKSRPELHEPMPDGRTHPSVSIGRLYIVLTLLTDDFRIVDDEGEPILVPRSKFDVLDDWIPTDWVREADEAEDWFWCGPLPFAVRGFFERWHDGHSRERQVFAEVYEPLWRHYEERLGGQEMVLQR